MYTFTSPRTPADSQMVSPGFRGSFLWDFTVDAHSVGEGIKSEKDIAIIYYTTGKGGTYM